VSKDRRLAMLGIGTFMKRIGNPLEAERVLMRHFADKRKVRCGWDRQYAQMVFGLKWDPVFHRHLNRCGCPIGQRDRFAA
jgi:hypothetical protein